MMPPVGCDWLLFPKGVGTMYVRGVLSIALCVLLAGHLRLAAGQSPPRGKAARRPSSGADQPEKQEDTKTATRKRSPRAPFVLTPEQQRVLRAWEARAAKVKTFQADFTLRVYDGVFAEGEDEPPPREYEGQLKYVAPDKGWFKVYSKPAEHWVCDGQAIYQFDYRKKQLIVRPLPEEMRGKAISEGPLPFVFGMEAEKLMARYFMRIVTPPDIEGEIWLEAYPRYREDAANFRKVDIILDAQDLLPYAIQLHEPNGKSRKSYALRDPVVNDSLQIFKKFFEVPRTPLGWERVVEEAGVAAQPADAPRRQAQGRSRGNNG
jgi:TIGR03009 family protein